MAANAASQNWRLSNVRPPTPRLVLVLVVGALHSAEHSVDAIDPKQALAGAADPTNCDLMPSATELIWAVVH